MAHSLKVQAHHSGEGMATSVRKRLVTWYLQLVRKQRITNAFSFVCDRGLRDALS